MMTRTMTWWTRRCALLGGVLALALCAGACGDDMESPSTLVDPQLLAIQMTPRNLSPGEPHQLVALGHDLDAAALDWSVCVLPWLPEEAGVRCAAEDIAELPAPYNAAIELGSGNPLTGIDTLPILETPCEGNDDCLFGTCADGSCAANLWLRVTDTRDKGALTTTLQVTSGAAAAHPTISRLETDAAGEALPDTLAASAELVVTPTFDDPNGAGGQVVSYFTTGGAFDPWRTRAEDGEAAPSTLTAPEEAGEITLTIIVRDPGGGVGWLNHTLTVTEAP
jgi:hypothetical protein